MLNSLYVFLAGQALCSEHNFSIFTYISGMMGVAQAFLFYEVKIYSTTAHFCIVVHCPLFPRNSLVYIILQNWNQIVSSINSKPIKYCLLCLLLYLWNVFNQSISSVFLGWGYHWYGENLLFILCGLEVWVIWVRELLQPVWWRHSPKLWRGSSTILIQQCWMEQWYIFKSFCLIFWSMIEGRR